MNVFLSAFFILSAGAPTPALAPQVDLPSVQRMVMTAWSDVHDYFVAHATQLDATTEALLEAEAEAGVKTWVNVAGTGGGGRLVLQELSGGPLDGPGVGWPSASQVIRFATTAERDTAASLIDEVTWSVPNSATIAGFGPSQPGWRSR